MKIRYNKTKIFENEKEEKHYTLEEFIRASAQEMLCAAVEDEVTEYLMRLPNQKSDSAEEIGRAHV